MDDPLKTPVGRRAALGGAAALGLAALLPRTLRAAVPPDEAQTVARIQAYLNSLRTLKAGFVQTTSTGTSATGTVYIQRPGKMRLDYAPPSPLQIYATGFWLIMVDSELREVNQVPLSSTPASVLVQDDIRLSGDIAVQGVSRRDHTLRIRLAKAGDEDSGVLTLVFAENPLALRQWLVRDAEGVTTRVALIAPQFNIAIPRKVFIFSPPDWAYPG